MTAITRLEINGFKAFPKEFVLDLCPDEPKNLLLYGENGSGKSSIYYALHVLLQSSFKDDFGAKYFKADDETNNEYLVNLNRIQDVKANTFSPYIKITLNNGETWRLDRDGLTSEHGTKIENFTSLNNEAIFINHSYISRCRTARNSEDIDLWDVFNKDILSFYRPEGASNFLSVIYDEIVEEASGMPNVNNKAFSRKIDKFNAPLKDLIDKANTKISDIYNQNFRFQDDKELSIELVYLEDADANNIHHESYYLFYGTKRHGKAISKSLHKPKIGLSIKEGGQVILKPQTYFNEAKFTAIALAIRFACIQAPSGFIVLDDMLISLDMSNRAKVVKFLISISGKYKIYLFTHDKMFFEYVKHKTQNYKDQWLYKEIYMDDNKCPYLRHSDDYLEQVAHFIKQHEYEIAGNCLRKAAELLCKNFLPKKWQFSTDYNQLNLNGLLQNCKRFAVESGIEDISTFKELDDFRKFILNPSSHDNYDVAKYRYEVEDCLHTLQSFQAIAVNPFLEYGTRLFFELKTPPPSIDNYKFELILCDTFKTIRQPDKEPVISKGLINYRVIHNGIPGKMQSDNTTLKHFYDKNYDKSDKSMDPNYLNSIIEIKTGKHLHDFI